MLIALIGFTLAYLLYVQVSGLFGAATRQADIYLEFAKLTQTNLKILHAEYNLYESNGTLYLYLGMLVRNEGIEPIYYRSPILAVVYFVKEGNDSASRETAEVYLSVQNSTSAFYPAITYKLTGLSIIDLYGYTPYKVVLLINGAELWSDLRAVDWPYSEDIYTCYTCAFCQQLVDNRAGTPITVLIPRDITIDKSPCIEFTGDGGGLTVDCSGNALRGTGTEVAFLFNNASNYTVTTCYVDAVDKAVEINRSSSIAANAITVSNSSFAVYLHEPTNASSYNIDLTDIMYGDKKLYFFKPGYGTSFTLFAPLAVWVSGFSGGATVDASGGVLERVYPLVSIINSSNVSLSNFSFQTSQPYGLIIIGSSSVVIQGADMNFLGSSYGIYSDQSSYSLQNVNIRSTATYDIYIRSSDVNLGDLNVR